MCSWVHAKSYCQIADPPADSSGDMTIYDHYTKTEVSVSITWSPSEGAEMYFISITSPSGQAMANFTTTESTLQLREVEYNVNYSISITAENCAGSNSITLAVVVGESIVRIDLTSIILWYLI